MSLPPGSWSTPGFGGGPFGGAPEVATATGAPPVPKKLGIGPQISGLGQVVPLTNQPNQTVTVSLNIDGQIQDYFLFIHYNEIAGYWLMTVEDLAGNILIDSLPFITGNNPSGNILGQYAYLGIGSAFIVSASSLDTSDYPGLANLGSAWVLIWSGTPAS